MPKNKSLEFTPTVILHPLLIVFVMWLVFWIEIRFHLDFNDFGIFPQKFKGLRGVIFGPFIHSNMEHLFNNSFPMLVLTISLFFFYQNVRWRVLIVGAILTGVLTWLIGRPANHIGMSGVIYMLTAFLFFKGIFSKQYQLTALAFVVVFLYGSLVWYVFPGVDPKISWEGHLSGFLVGFGLSFLFKKPAVLKNKKYAWESPNFNPDNDPFMRQFDDDGNFIEITKEPTIEALDTTLENNEITVIYNYTEKNENTEL